MRFQLPAFRCLLQPLLYGKPITPDADGNKCDIDGIANPDNIFYTNNILFIAEDTTSHFNSEYQLPFAFMNEFMLTA
jgi:hypothetical protein